MAASRVVWRQNLRFQPNATGRRAVTNCRSIVNGTAASARTTHPYSHDLPPSPAAREFDSRWLSVIKGRLGKCFTFGLKPHQIDEAGEILQVIARDWRELTAGSEGFLTGIERQGLYRHNVVWGEMQVSNPTAIFSGHVNNVSYVRYAETARVNWTRNIGTHVDRANKRAWFNLLGSTGVGLILKSIKIDYKFPMTAPDKISVYHKLAYPPPAPSSPASSAYSSFQLDVLILSEAHQRPAARCHEDIVAYDYQLGRKAKMLPPFMMDQFRTLWELQEASKRTWGVKVKEIEARVRRLETASWDRPDAVEDMGSSG
ncbi:conserved hypothetical protein [Histoplasma capsulatum var. duboisii H88]|uniref:Thioesterase n=1 Tax=Ajellomyces capsulatus (strain H88) TaxID=544711 RepID=F0U5Q5_AJEC8|nr:conserved hypothetical protein [Histoplasma capsulatum var. duboisii H88]